MKLWPNRWKNKNNVNRFKHNLIKNHNQNLIEMKNKQLLILLILVLFSTKSIAQNELIYVADQSEKKKSTNPKRLEGLEGNVEKVTLRKQKEDHVEFSIYFEGYAGKHIKVFALSKTGGRKLEIPPYLKKIAPGKNLINFDLNLAGSKEVSTDFIEVAFTNGGFVFKGISYVFKLKKDWSPRGNSTGGTAEDPRLRQSQIVELTLKPIGKARQTFIR